MKANELRIGNWVNTSERAGVHYQICRQGRIRTINNTTANITPNQCISPVVTINLKNIDPIPITEEWLLKFGFEKGNSIYPEGFSLFILGTDFYLRPCYNGGFYWGFNLKGQTDCEFFDAQSLKYLHQIQNLYFALTGEELKTIFESDGIKIIPD